MVKIRNAQYEADTRPLDEAVRLLHLPQLHARLSAASGQCGEILAARLGTIHNLHLLPVPDAVDARRDRTSNASMHSLTEFYVRAACRASDVSFLRAPAGRAAEGPDAAEQITMLADLPTAPWFRRLLVAGLILGIVLLTFTVLRPFIVPLIWGGILAYVSWPLNQWVLRMLGGRAGLASLVTTLIVTLVIVVPIVWLALMLRVEALSAYSEVQAFLASKPSLPPALRDLPWIGAYAQEMLEQLSRIRPRSGRSSC